MNFHVFGDVTKPVIILVHGVLTPWQVWQEQIGHLKEHYHVVAVALDAHEEERASRFISVDDEARQIEDYICNKHGGEVFAVCGLSMGGVIAHEIWKNGRVKLKKLIMDGAPLSPMPKIATKIMTSNYLTIIRKSKKRDPKTLESFKKQFLPERYLESYLKIADNMDDDSMRNIVASAMSKRLCTNVGSDADVLFIHGTKGNEVVSKKVGKQIKQHYPQACVICFDGYKHCEAAIYEPEKWLRYVEEFLEK
ncbi:MAG: alpha/beta hydrolase [Ruminococcaceae bacterium]|nr:alpha/beta hydrolase [Oscillospiraceae bacterium]